MTLDTDDTRLCAAIATEFAPQQPATLQATSMRAAFFKKISDSARAHQEYLTIRREDGVWRTNGDISSDGTSSITGPRSRTLRADSSTRVEIIRLSAGQALPWPAGVVAQEILVLSGGLARHGDSSPLENPAEPAVMPPHAHCLRWANQPGLALVAVDEVTLYVRQLLVDAQTLPTLEAHWWHLPTSRGGWSDPGRKRWRPTTEGVEVMPLQGDGDVVSMLVRFAPGASVSDHQHTLNEDCLVLEGEMFLGDILLRSGDYQLAPAGGSHFGETSDVGVVFFFHGSIDPVLRGDKGSEGR